MFHEGVAELIVYEGNGFRSIRNLCTRGRFCKLEKLFTRKIFNGIGLMGRNDDAMEGGRKREREDISK